MKYVGRKCSCPDNYLLHDAKTCRIVGHVFERDDGSKTSITEVEFWAGIHALAGYGATHVWGSMEEFAPFSNAMLAMADEDRTQMPEKARMILSIAQARTAAIGT